MCGKFLVANSHGLLYRELDRGHVKVLELKKKILPATNSVDLILIKKINSVCNLIEHSEC